MTIQFLEEMIQEINDELRAMRKYGFDRVRILELGVVLRHLKNKQIELDDEMKEDYS